MVCAVCGRKVCEFSINPLPIRLGIFFSRDDVYPMQSHIIESRTVARRHHELTHIQHRTRNNYKIIIAVRWPEYYIDRDITMCGVRAQRDCAVRGVSAILLSGAKNLNRKRRSLDVTLYTCSMNANGSGGCDGGARGSSINSARCGGRLAGNRRNVAV